MASSNSVLNAFAEAAVVCAAGGCGQPLVDAAAEALAAGVDSPTLRQLAGAPRAFADEEAQGLAPKVFEELGLVIQAFPYERNENFIARERVFEIGGVVAQTLQADDSSPSPSLTTPVAARAVRRESQ